MSEREVNGHVEAEILSAYMEGDLDAGEASGVQAHLEGCDRCARVAAELETVVERARTAEDVAPARDLWPGVAEAIGAGDGEVGELPGRRSEARRYGFTGPQLAAAAMVLMLLSGAGAWLAHPGSPGGRVGPPAATSGTERPVRRAATEDPGVPEEYRSELEELQGVLREHRDDLAPNTIRVLEKNLAVIDRAIRESREALRMDPGNPFLENHLDRAYRTKVEYLREAVRIVRWSS